MDIYEKNLKALKSVNPELEGALRAIDSNERFDLFTGKETCDINILDTHLNQAMFTHPAQELALELKSQLPKSKYPFRYFYGVANGCKIINTLQNEYVNSILVFEPFEELIYIMLNLHDLSTELATHKLQLFNSNPTFQELYLRLKKSNFSYIQHIKTFSLEVTSNYYENFSDEILSTNQTMIDVLKYTLQNFGNDINDTLMGVEHQMQNFATMLHHPSYKEILKKRNSKSAIIVSTGPSLHKQLPLLKEIQEYVTIFSVDASFPILSKYGIKPDVVTSLERIQETAQFYEKTTKEDQKDVLFLLVSIVHQRLLDAIEGSELSLIMRDFSWLRYFGFDEYGYLGGGRSAAHMALEIIFNMHYENIIFIGQDLSFSNEGLSHSSGHVLGEGQMQSDGLDCDGVQYDLCELEAYGGEGSVKSIEVWKAFLQDFEVAIAHHNKRVNIYNATEGGARIHGTQEISFKTFTTELLKSNPKKKVKLSLDEPSQKVISQRLQKLSSTIRDTLKYSYKTQKRVEKAFLVVTEAFEDIQMHQNNNTIEQIDYDKLLYISDHVIQPIRELESDKRFTLFHDILNNALLKDELELAAITTQYTTTPKEAKIRLINWVLLHRAWLFNFAGALDAMRSSIKSGLRKAKCSKN